MKSYLVICLTIALSWSCTQPSGNAERQHEGGSTAQQSQGNVADLEQQVMAAHDRLMPQLSDILRLKKQVTSKAIKGSRKVADEGARVSRQLDEADHSMMDWMHQYNGDTLSKLDQPKALSYLMAQQTKLNSVRDQIRNSLTNAQNYLQ